MSIAIYIRVSTVEQNAEGQRQAIKSWLAGHGYTTVAWYEDLGLSGDNLNRPAMTKLQADIFSGKIKTVVCYKLDRLSRSMGEGIDLLCSWIKTGVRVVSVTQQLDFNGTVGQLVAAVLLAVSQMEQETRRERQAAGIAVAKSDGKYKGRVKGSVNTKLRNGVFSRERVLELRGQGLKHQEIANALNCSERTVRRALTE